MVSTTDTKTWTPDIWRRHRLWRAFNELVLMHTYTLRVRDGVLRISPASVLTPEAKAFVEQYRDDLRIHAEWLGEIKHDATTG